ncbi:hypothetical protein V494_05722 [Pseudogymnoascus sp. VKM F-4513 (FW-928)]|nr:hypothetical protein V494_05722 [Pseudogymnoascus sp. VKM F-4513 (FW-928)]
MRPHRLLRGKMMRKRSRDSQRPLPSPTTPAPAPLLNRTQVISIPRVLHIQHPLTRHRVPEPRSPRRPHAVKHVRAERNTDNKILGIPNPHHVPRLVLRLTAFTTHVQIKPALDNTEEVLGLGLGVRGDAAVEPADGAEHGFAHALGVGGGGHEDVVELHDDVGADGVLEADGVFGGEEHGGAVVGGEEADAFFGDGGEFEERDHLEAVGGEAVKASSAF